MNKSNIFNGLDNVSELTYALLGEDFNPFCEGAKERFTSEMSLFISSYKELIHVLAQAKREGLKPAEVTGFINKLDLAFLLSLVPSGTTLIEESDLNYAIEIASLMGEDFNPYNWDAKTRIPLTIGLIVMHLKKFCHIFIQAGKEGLTMEQLVDGLDHEMIEIIMAA